MGWLDDWAKRIELTIDNTNIDSDLTNFPVLIYLSAASGIGDVDVSAVFDELTADANRKKIAVTSSDGTTQLYVEIERWDDANEKAWLWVKVPSVTAASSTTLYLYYDSAKADNTTYVGDTGDTPAQNVWDSNFVGVWHMAQDPNGDGADAIKDSTSNANHGTPAGAMTSADLVDGKIGKTIDFDGGDDYIDLGNDSNLEPGTGPFTWETLINSSDTSVRMCVLGKQNQSSPFSYEGWVIRISQAGNDRKLHIQLIEDSATAAIKVKGSTALFDSTDYNITISYDGSEAASGISMFVNGVGETEIIEMDTLSSTITCTKDAHIGSAGDTGSNYFGGIIDEVRMSTTARSAVWIKSTYYSNWDDLISWGEEETTFIEDASLDLSTYGRSLENLQSYFRAHDGIELRDLQATLEAFGLSTEDFSTLLIAALESTGDFAANFETWATQYKDLAGDFDAKGQNIESMMSRFETARAEYKNLATFFSVTDGSVLNDLTAFLSVTDGSTLKNLGLYLKAVQSVPAFRSITAQRVSSVVHEVS